MIESILRMRDFSLARAFWYKMISYFLERMQCYFSEIIVLLACIAEMEHIEGFAGSFFSPKAFPLCILHAHTYCFASDVRNEIWQYAVHVSVYMGIFRWIINSLWFYLSKCKLWEYFFFLLLHKNSTISCPWERGRNIHLITWQVWLQNQFFRASTQQWYVRSCAVLLKSSCLGSFLFQALPCQCES